MRGYSERLSVPVGWWLLGVVSIAILGAELWGGLGLLAALGTYAVLLVGCGSMLAYWGLASIRVTERGLEAGGHVLPHAAIGEVTPLDERQARAVGGQHADPAAYLLLRPYLKRAVYVEVIDPGCAAPYWLLATRRPAELAAALRASPARAGAQDTVRGC